MPEREDKERREDIDLKDEPDKQSDSEHQTSKPEDEEDELEEKLEEKCDDENEGCKVIEMKKSCERSTKHDIDSKKNKVGESLDVGVKSVSSSGEGEEKVKEKEKAVKEKDSKDKEKDVLHKSKQEKDQEKDGESDEKDAEEDQMPSSKLKAEALSASLSSSRCLLKRNREDLDEDSDDATEEEPDCKKYLKVDDGDDEAAVGDDTEKDTDVEKEEPVLIEKSKLSESELVASMSSSKSVLKRRIEEVDVSDDGENDAEAPEKLKKSNTPQEDDRKTKVMETPPAKPLQRQLTATDSVNLAKKLDFDSSSLVTKTTLSPPLRPSPVKLTSNVKSPAPGAKEDDPRRPGSVKKSPKEEVKEVRVIAAKDLAEDRKLERKRLNKMLAIFDDQKPIK